MFGPDSANERQAARLPAGSNTPRILQAQELIHGVAECLATVPDLPSREFAADFRLCLDDCEEALGLLGAPTLTTAASTAPIDLLAAVEPSEYVKVANALFCAVAIQKKSGVTFQREFGNPTTSALLTEHAAVLYLYSWNSDAMGEGAVLFPKGLMKSYEQFLRYFGV